jgi:hypothetical protein
VYLRGGPLDGKVYSTAQLLGAPEPLEHIRDYVWTAERVTSDKTGKSAQVWVFNGYTEKDATETK